MRAARRSGVTAAVLAALLAWHGAAVHGATDAVQAFAAGLPEASRWDALEFSARADAFGELVNAAREREDGAAAQQRLRDLGDELHAACRARIRALEAATGDDEAQLESLYRSEQWYAINYALAAVRYWQAWIDLALAQTAADDAARVPALSRAERGFQATAVRILYPGLVYGSWLGMASVDRLRGDEAAAERRLKLLASALASDPDNPLAKIVQDELAVLAVRRGGALGPLPAGEGKLEPAVARRLEEEAFVLLERRRKEGISALDAAERLRRVIDAGYLDDALLARMLAWRDELVGRDMGTVGLLLDAEHAAAHGQYETTVLKYREFAGKGGFDLPIDTAPWRYNYALALHRTGYQREALEVASRLGEDTAVGTAARKLAFLAAERQYRDRRDSASRATLERAARDFLRVAPADEDAAFAHLVLASGSDVEAASHLAVASRDRRTRQAVQGQQLDAAVAAFNAAAARNDFRARGSAARSALALIGELPRAERRAPAVRALELQMRVASGETGEPVLQELADLRQAAAGDAALQRVLAWTTLRALSADELAGYVASLPDPPAPADAVELVTFLHEREQAGDTALLADLAARAQPAFASQPDVARQIALMRCRALGAQGRHDEAFGVAMEMVQAWPGSGDAWLAYAESAERKGDGFAAERGWARIAAAVPEGSDRWLDAMLRRVALLTRTAGVQSAHCALLQEARAYEARMDAPRRARLAELSGQNRCDGASS